MFRDPEAPRVWVCEKYLETAIGACWWPIYCINKCPHGQTIILWNTSCNWFCSQNNQNRTRFLCELFLKCFFLFLLLPWQSWTHGPGCMETHLRCESTPSTYRVMDYFHMYATLISLYICYEPKLVSDMVAT